MTVGDSLLIGALATLLVFAIVMSNVAFSEKVYTDLAIEKECSYDVMALFDLSEEPGISMDEGRMIVERHSPITAEQDFQLYTTGETILCSSILGYEEMGLPQCHIRVLQHHKHLFPHCFDNDF